MECSVYRIQLISANSPHHTVKSFFTNVQWQFHQYFQTFWFKVHKILALVFMHSIRC